MDPTETDTFDMTVEERLWPSLEDYEEVDFCADQRPDPDDLDDDEFDDE